jgi:hypothetical protein
MAEEFRLFVDGEAVSPEGEMRLLIDQLAALCDAWTSEGRKGVKWTKPRFGRAVGYANRDGFDDARKAAFDGERHILKTRILDAVAHNRDFPEYIRRTAMRCALLRANKRAVEKKLMNERLAQLLYPRSYLAQFEGGSEQV